MYIRGLIPWDFAELPEAVPIGMETVGHADGIISRGKYWYCLKFKHAKLPRMHKVKLDYGTIRR